jgi:hypothetical protein
MGRIRDAASLIGFQNFHPRSERGSLLIPTEQGFHPEPDQNNLVPDPKRIIAFITRLPENDRLGGKMPRYSKDWKIRGYPIERKNEKCTDLDPRWNHVRIRIREGTSRIRTIGPTVPKKGGQQRHENCFAKDREHSDQL